MDLNTHVWVHVRMHVLDVSIRATITARILVKH